MTDLSRLRTSDTKHGAHKIAILLRKYDKDEVLNHLRGSVPGVNIEKVQAKKNLSVQNGSVPDVWNEARAKGDATIDALVLIAIILSHYDLINALKNSTDRKGFAGTVKRSGFSSVKAYTNLADTMKQLGYLTERVHEHFRYDLEKLFQIPGLNTLFEEVLKLKLLTAGWDQKNSLIEEAIRLGIQEVFSLTEGQFSSWITTCSLTKKEELEADDAAFFREADDDVPVGKFEFKPGHNDKKTGVIKAKMSAKEKRATLLHNQIQNELYTKLVAEFGAACVGTEVPTGDGTSIDVVVQTAAECCFYEIKTHPSVRVCIRQAVPQLLEYAYWQGNATRADKLIIVSPSEITVQAATYLNFLRAQFNLNIHYEKFEVTTAITG